MSGGELRELEAHVGRQLVPLAPVCVRGSAQDAADLVYLIYLGAAREERPPGVELGHDAAHRPHVDGTGVVGGPEQNLRGAVPPRGDVLGQRARVVKVGVGDAGEPEVADPEEKVELRLRDRVG